MLHHLVAMLALLLALQLTAGPALADRVVVMRGTYNANARTNIYEYVGDETPGGTASTPDQSNVDDIGRAYGLQEEDTGALRSAEEVLARRDRRRSELRPPGKSSA